MTTRRVRRRHAAMAVLALALGGCTGGQRTEQERTVRETPAAASDAPAATPSAAATTPSVPDVPDCVLSAEHFAAVVGVDEAESVASPDYGYPGDKSCSYFADARAWNVYLFPRDGDHAQAQRRGASAHHSDVTPFELAGAIDAIQFDQGRTMLFGAGDFVVKVECLTDDAPAYREDLAAALVAAVGAL